MRRVGKILLWVLVALAVLLVVAWFALRRPDTPYEQLEAKYGNAESEYAETDSPLGHGFAILIGQGPARGVKHVVEHSHSNGDELHELLHVEARTAGERVAHQRREIDAGKAAATVRRQRFFRTGVRGFDTFAVMQVVVRIYAIDKHDTGLAVVIC